MYFEGQKRSYAHLKYDPYTFFGCTGLRFSTPQGEKMPNYRKFTREEMIADLEYYYEHTKKQYIDILTLKNGWKKEEYDAKKFRVSLFFPFSDTHSETLENVAGAERRTRDRLVQR